MAANIILSMLARLHCKKNEFVWDLWVCSEQADASVKPVTLPRAHCLGTKSTMALLMQPWAQDNSFGAATHCPLCCLWLAVSWCRSGVRGSAPQTSAQIRCLSQARHLSQYRKVNLSKKEKILENLFHNSVFYSFSFTSSNTRILGHRSVISHLPLRGKGKESPWCSVCCSQINVEKSDL